MKRLFLLILLIMTVAVMANAQDTTKKVSKPNVVKDKDGNYVSLSGGTTSVKTETGKFLIEKDGTKLPIYLSKNNKMYVIKTSKKSGKSYNKYLTE